MGKVKDGSNDHIHPMTLDYGNTIKTQINNNTSTIYVKVCKCSVYSSLLRLLLQVPTY